MFVFPGFKRSILWLEIKSYAVEKFGRKEKKGLNQGNVGNPKFILVFYKSLLILNVICLLAACAPCQKSVS